VRFGKKPYSVEAIIAEFKIQMNGFEGYTGIQAGEGQLVNDTMFALLLCLFIFFAIVFRTHFRLFIKMLKDVGHVKQRQSLFETPVNNAKGNEWVFRIFMTFQALLLTTIFFFETGRKDGYFHFKDLPDLLLVLGFIFSTLLLFYFLKQGIYYILGWVFAEKEQFDLWKNSYHAIMGTWGVLLYLPIIWLVFVYKLPSLPLILFIILYILCRFVIFYNNLRIFQIKKDGYLYIILYLCGQEIMPVFLLYYGIIHLYNFIEMSIIWR